MDNWVNCNGTWTNLNQLFYIYPAPISKNSNQWRIEAYTIDDDIIEFLTNRFDSEEDAQNYLNDFMSNKR